MSAGMESEGCTHGHSDGVNNDYANGIEKGTCTHLLIVPMVLQAAAASAFRLAKKLSGRGVTVTLVMIKQNADELHRMYSREALQTLRISIEALDGYQPPSLPFPQLHSASLKDAFRMFKEKLIANKKAGLPVPTCILADRWIPWIEDIANVLDIPRYIFVSNAVTLSRVIQLYHEKEDELKSLPNGPDWFQKSYELLRQQPGLEFLKKATDVPYATIDNGWFDYFRDIGRSFPGAHGIVFNSFYALEHQSVEAFRSAYPGSNKLKVPPVYLIGPLATAGEFNNVSFVAGLEDTHKECVEWLQAQPTKSVLFICLGGATRLFGEQITQLARALEASECRFLWALTKGRGNFESVDEVLPPGYLERVRGRGKIVTGWVGQVEILSNPAVGVFLSHCGWQSVLESLTCGVPLLGWPQTGDQPLNCRWMQEALKVGMRVTEKEPGELVEQHEFEEAIKTLMSEKERTVLAANAAKMMSMAAEAVAAGGPSDIALDQLVESFSTFIRGN
uniref:Glycosyltransferase n=1 Tax=Plagiochasma appendiculatum TaxID=157224 RepID=A0A7G4WF18_9MARC|nr:UDP-glycosyltransferase 3 [Plagiochasma appendiculatum]